MFQTNLRYAHLFSFLIYPGRCGPQRSSNCFRCVFFMQTPVVVKCYRVFTRKESRWYKIVFLIQKGKTSAVYIIKTQDCVVLDSLCSSCCKEVRDRVIDIAGLLLGRTYSAYTYLTFSSKYAYFNSISQPCKMKNYRKLLIL